MKTRLEVNAGTSGPFLVLDLQSDGAFTTIFLTDLTPEDLGSVAAEYRLALEVHRAKAIGTALEGLGEVV